MVKMLGMLTMAVVIMAVMMALVARIVGRWR